MEFLEGIKYNFSWIARVQSGLTHGSGVNMWVTLYGKIEMQLFVSTYGISGVDRREESTSGSPPEPCQAS